MAGPALAQVSGPIDTDEESGQQTYQGNTTDPDFSPYTPEQQSWDRDNLSTTGTGTALVGALGSYQVNLPAFSWREANEKSVNLGWMHPAGSGVIGVVRYQILPGRRSNSTPAQIVDSCPSDSAESFRMYQIMNGANNMLNLGQSLRIKKCSSHRLTLMMTPAAGEDGNNGHWSFVLRLKGKVEMTAAGGYRASFGPHNNSPFNCGPPTWPTPAHQAAGHPPYAEWCDLDIRIDVD
ncbi:MAG: hypothetical protein OXE48_00810 [Gammaproteobacteria bacterium]|nr:hypothetical protein [Gammaproteobacteria bacterium]